MTQKDDSTGPGCLPGGDPRLVELARERGLSAVAARAMADIDVAIGRIRRNIVRRDFGRIALAALDSDLEPSHLDAIMAIAGAPTHGGDRGDEVTVGLLAERLGIDPSRASRIASDIVERGYVRRSASQADARRICLELTSRGDAFLAAVREGKFRLFSRALAKWEEADLVVFARLLDRFGSWTTDTDGVEEMRRHLHGLGEAPDKAAE